MNTPNTEWEKVARVFYQAHLCYELNRATEQTFIDFITKLISSRDTYWKERVRKEVEGISEFNAKLAISPSPDFLKGAVAMKKMILDNLK